MEVFVDGISTDRFKTILACSKKLRTVDCDVEIVPDDYDYVEEIDEDDISDLGEFEKGDKIYIEAPGILENPISCGLLPDTENLNDVVEQVRMLFDGISEIEVGGPIIPGISIEDLFMYRIDVFTGGVVVYIDKHENTD